MKLYRACAGWKGLARGSGRLLSKVLLPREGRATAAMLSLEQTISEKRLILCVGAGGVGKTTTAASLALRCAQKGYRSLVLTIDPAKRLATSLGLTNLGHAPQKIDSQLLSQVSSGSGELWAMMLDQKQAFDRMVGQLGSDPAAIARILKNPVYKQISGSLAGAQEYAALITLAELLRDTSYDKIIIDTPPTAHALDFLDAPQKLTMAIDSPAVDWFRKMSRSDPGGWSLVGRAGASVLKRLSAFVGNEFLSDISVFFTEFGDILQGFRQRAELAYALLRQSDVGFVLVASPDPIAFGEAEAFFHRLRESKLPFAGFVLNRVHRKVGKEISDREVVALVGENPAVQALHLGPENLEVAAHMISACYRDVETLAAHDELTVARARRLVAPAPVLTVPMQEQDVHSVPGLAHIADFLVGKIHVVPAA